MACAAKPGYRFSIRCYVQLSEFGYCLPTCHARAGTSGPEGSGQPTLTRARRGAMAVVCTQGAGRDVPMPRGMACRMTPDPTGPPAEGLVEGPACGRRTVDGLALSAELAEAGRTPVARERTGADGKPVCHR
jgi:hypothetical protein